MEPQEVIESRAESLMQFHRGLVRDLVKVREAHGVLQDVLAARMGVTQSAVSQFERYDSNPTLATLRRYALAVGARIEHEVIDDYSSASPGRPRLRGGPA